MGWTDRIAEQREVGVVVERHALKSRWAAHRWHPATVLMQVPEARPWTKLSEEGGATRYYAGPATITLVPSEAESYLYNLTGRAPQIWIVLRPCAPARDGRDVELDGATVAAGEAEVLAGAAELVVEAVPMPLEIVDWVAAFLAEHPNAPDSFKRKRSDYVSEGKALADKLERGDE